MTTQGDEEREKCEAHEPWSMEVCTCPPKQVTPADCTCEGLNLFYGEIVFSRPDPDCRYCHPAKKLVEAKKENDHV